MLIKVGKREDAIHALINVWLKDPRKKCGWCGTLYHPAIMPCCEQPFIGTNLDIFDQFYRELKKDRATRRNVYASSDSKEMRWKLKFPPSLLQFLTSMFRKQYDEELFNDKYSTNWFAKKFRKYFTVPDIV
jgi:hypothetical protein